MFRSIEQFFIENPKVALAFSGGVDSSFLFYAAQKAGARIRAYYVNTPFQPAFELEDAKKIAAFLRGDMKVLTLDILEKPEITENMPMRCYFCKRSIFSEIIAAAAKDGYELLIDGTNADDDADDRPGMAALREMSVCSPLRDFGYTKEEIRRLSKEAGLFTWNKPAYACLATRIRTGETITREKLICTEKAENYLFDLGFRDFRIRMTNGTAKIQVKPEQMDKVIRERNKILNELEQYYDAVVLDLKER